MPAEQEVKTDQNEQVAPENAKPQANKKQGRSPRKKALFVLFVHPSMLNLGFQINLKYFITNYAILKQRGFRLDL